MIRRVALLALLAVSGLALAADPPAPPPVAAPFLWEVQGPKAKHFVLGSVHLLPPAARPLPPALDAAYAATQVLVLETDLEALASPEVQGRMLGAAREDQPGGLRAQIGRSLYKKLQKRARALGMPAQEVCAELRAWFCALTLELYPLQQAGFSIEYGIDQHYYSLARDDGRPVIGLETPQFQVELFARMPQPLAKQMLAATLDEATYESQTPEELYRMWRTGDLGTLEEVVEDLRKRYPELYARILADRTRAWAEPLAERMKAEVPMLVIVGAAHLPGPDGLLALLKARGLEAKLAPVPPAPGRPVSPG
jgi:uncharacterized protein YbaP (TraB family)